MDKKNYLLNIFVHRMKNQWYFIAAVCALCGCEPIQEQIIGTYEIDADHGCTSCAENGPELMVFEDDDVSDGIPGDYRFEFADSEEHSGTYGFLQVDSTITIVLYPENATSLYSQLIGESVLTDYRVTRSRVKENCNGLLKNCIWVRKD